MREDLGEIEPDVADEDGAARQLLLVEKLARGCR